MNVYSAHISQYNPEIEPNTNDNLINDRISFQVNKEE